MQNPMNCCVQDTSNIEKYIRNKKNGKFSVVKMKNLEIYSGRFVIESCRSDDGGTNYSPQCSNIQTYQTSLVVSLASLKTFNLFSPCILSLPFHSNEKKFPLQLQVLLRFQFLLKFAIIQFVQ